jgi:hypothetical protein
MGANIGPWSKEILGFEVTPQQFLANPQIQDAIFQGKFGQYEAKYGPEGAAKAWFAGEKGMNNPNAKDVLGTSVSGYGAKFMKALGQPQMANPASAPQMAVGASAPSSMPAYGWSPNNAPAATAESRPSQDMGQMPQMSAPEINYARPRPPDPKQMQALLKLNPALSRVFSFRG